MKTERKLSFEEIPELLIELTAKIEALEIHFDQLKPNVAEQTQDEIMDVSETARFLKLSVQTIYGKVQSGEIPVMKRSKKLYFSKNELLAYLRQGRRKTNIEIQEAAKSF